MNTDGNTASAIGLVVPDFTAVSTSEPLGEPFSLLAQRGHPVIIYFYPKDSTPGCTTEAMQFRDLHDKFSARGAKILVCHAIRLNLTKNSKAILDCPLIC